MIMAIPIILTSLLKLNLPQYDFNLYQVQYVFTVFYGNFSTYNLSSLALNFTLTATEVFVTHGLILSPLVTYHALAHSLLESHL